MAPKVISEGWVDLVDELKQLEQFFPQLGIVSEHDELEEEVNELEQLIATAGIPEDEHSMRALTFLQSELTKKRSFLSKMQ
ncbi:MAG: hypothetical protein EXR86_10350 [Gammaproteobacteria bacterium]|nr:hypothetical protein [Gammaproteobacteria bacterium]